MKAQCSLLSCQPFQFIAANKIKFQFMIVKEAENNSIIKKQSKMVLYEKNDNTVFIRVERPKFLSKISTQS